MDVMRIAILVDMTIYACSASPSSKIWGKHFPTPWNRKFFVIPVELALGALVTMVSFPRWVVFPD